MKMRQVRIAVAAMLVCVAVNMNAATVRPVTNHTRPTPEKARPEATTWSPGVQLVAIGSSALWLELGQASATSMGCSWTAAKGTVNAVDLRVGGGTAEKGATWITWTPGAGSCASPGTGFSVAAEMNTDSVIGNRCYFASPRCTISVPAAQVGVSGQNSLTGITDYALPAVIQTALNGASFNAAATDIRPEDAKFAALRMFTACGTPVVTGSQYLGLGYGTGTAGVGTAIKESPLSGSGSFNVFDFNLMGKDPITGNTLPGSYVVTSVGAVPVVVFVNPSDEAGFGSLLVSNINRAVLAGYLDGTYGRTSDINTQTAAGGSTGTGSTVFIREPLSGTYNTMEFAVPNSVELQTSQDLGLAAVNANGGTSGIMIPPAYCSTGGGATWSSSMNPLIETAESLGRSVSSSNPNPGRYRAIGTGDEVAAVLANQDSLGYAFWSAANFAKATATTGKYLTVDGVDPLQQTWVDGLIPTSGNELLGNVTMAHVKDGSYPIWSILRLVSDQTAVTAVDNLVTAAAAFLSPTQPDFVHASQLTIVRSHFAPPGVNFPSCTSAGGTSNLPANGTGTAVECGGDVGGLVMGIGSDKDYNTDTVSQFGNIGRRQ